MLLQYHIMVVDLRKGVEFSELSIMQRIMEDRNTPIFTDAHDGCLIPQSAHLRFSSLFNNFNKLLFIVKLK